MVKATPPKPKSKPAKPGISKSAMGKLSPAEYKKVMAVVDRAAGKGKSPSPAQRGKAANYAKNLKPKKSSPKKKLDKDKADIYILDGMSKAAHDSFMSKVRKDTATDSYNKVTAKRHGKEYVDKMRKEATKGVAKKGYRG
tara:strand:+ start:175 stop:594 length:420 start_codon:yes stop_codon:yes gene_type:complete